MDGGYCLYLRRRIQSLYPWYQSQAFLAVSLKCRAGLMKPQAVLGWRMENVQQEFVGKTCMESGGKRSSTPSALI